VAPLRGSGSKCVGVRGLTPPARVVAPLRGSGRGSVFGREVVVAPLRGSGSTCLGGLWGAAVRGLTPPARVVAPLRGSGEGEWGENAWSEDTWGDGTGVWTGAWTGDAGRVLSPKGETTVAGGVSPRMVGKEDGSPAGATQPFLIGRVT